jgi:hypothetical protein
MTEPTMSDLEQLSKIKTQTLALIADITAQPKPNYSIDGQTIDWAEYLAQLQDTVQWCDRQLAAATPVEMRTRAYT